MLLVSLQFVNQTDLKALDTESVFEDVKQEDEIDTESGPVSTGDSDYTQFELYHVKSYAMINAFESVLDSDYGDSIDSLSVVNGILSAKGDIAITGLLIGVDPNLVKAINLSENKISYKIELFTPPEVDQSSMSVSNFLNSVVDIKNIDFKLIDGRLLDEKVDNLILRVDQKDMFKDIMTQIKGYNNFIIRKMSFKKSDNSTHIYITVLN